MYTVTALTGVTMTKEGSDEAYEGNSACNTSMLPNASMSYIYKDIYM